MSKFYPLIWKSLAGLATREEREIVYDRSREALRAMQEQNPGFSNEEVSAQSRELEDAIERAERETEKSLRRQSSSSLSSAFQEALSQGPKVPAGPRDPAELSGHEGVGSGLLAGKAPAIPTDRSVGEPRARIARSPELAPGKAAAEQMEKGSVSASNPRGLRALKVVAAALAILIVPLALWFYRQESTKPQAVPTESRETAPQPLPVELAMLYRGPDKLAGPVSWRAEPATTSDGKDAGFHVEATFEPAQQLREGLKLAVTVSGNTPSESNPAPQVAELRFTSRLGQPIEIKTAPGILIRKSSSDVGEPLLALAARSSVPGLFILATSPVSSDAEANFALLQDSGWIDIPFVDADDTPAVVAIPVSRSQGIVREAVNSWRSNAR